LFSVRIHVRSSLIDTIRAEAAMLTLAPARSFSWHDAGGCNYGQRGNHVLLNNGEQTMPNTLVQVISRASVGWQAGGSS
jgi:hypothetical protein